jgi:hypothetical protein
MAISILFYNMPLLFAICVNTFSKLVWGLGECDMGRGSQWCPSVINSDKSQVWHEGQHLFQQHAYIYSWNLVIRSIGRCRFSHLCSGGSVRWTARLLGWVCRRELYWILKRRISSLAGGIWRSCRRITLGTYHGASAIMRRALDCKRSRMSIFEVELYAVGPDRSEDELVEQ